MLLYELKDPVEVKYGGTLDKSERTRCKKQTTLSSPRWNPYKKRAVRVENLCGRIVSAPVEQSSAACSAAASSALASGTKHDVTGPGAPKEGSVRFAAVNPHPAYNHQVKSVCFKNSNSFGQQYEIFHVAGHITAKYTPGLPKTVLFKGVRGANGVQQISEDLMFDSTTQAHVHMGIFSGYLGIRLQTTEWCYLENKVFDEYGPFNGGWIRVEPRLMDQCNIIRLSVTDWHKFLPKELHPISNDMVITCRGSITLRFTWVCMHWTKESECEILRACDEISAAILGAHG